MANITGLITVNNKEVLEVDAAPDGGAGTPAPIGSLAMYDSGVAGFLYIKTGAADTAWSVVSSGNDWTLAGNTLVGGEYFGSNNNQDVLFYRNGSEQMRMANNALLIGLSSSIGGRLQLADSVANADFMAEIFSPGANQVIKVNRMNRLTTSGAATASNTIAVPTDTCCLIESRATARQTAGSSGVVGQGASYIRSLHATNQAGVVSIFSQQSDYTYEIVNAMNYSGAASGSDVVFTVTGAANRDFTWGLHTNLLIVGS
jgi:hypothetical protein